MKRFIETTIWTQNKWFRKLSPRNKLFWIYLICNCDAVGVWEEDLELASFIMGEEITKDEINKSFDGKILWVDDKKVWIKDFCNFQYGPLNESNINNKPHQSYINLLKKHSLWIEYAKGIEYPMERDKEKEKDKDKEKVKDKDKDFVDKIVDEFVEAHGNYEVINKGKEREMAGKILSLYKKQYPDSNSEDTLQGLRHYFDLCVDINDQWLRNNMSLSIIVSKFNEINSILRNGKSKGTGATDQELTKLIAEKLRV